MEFSFPPLREALIFLPFVLPIAIWAAWSDLARLKIPNKAVLAMAALWPLLGWLVFPWQLWLMGFAIMAIVLVICFIGNMAGLFGAGDAKYAAAMAGIFTAGDPMFIAALYAVCSIGALVVQRGLALSAMVVLYLLAAFLPKG
jgi:prepilin peptidase CpaA